MIKMISGVQNYVYYHLKKNEEIWFGRLMRSEFQKNVNAWSAVYRISTEKVLLKELRDWDSLAWWQTQYLGWNIRNNWDTMVSVVEKLICGDENCLRAISYVFIMQNLEQKISELKFNEIKTEKYHPKQKKTHLNKN